VKEKDLKPIGEPALTDLNYTRGEKMSCTISYEIRPQIALKEYKGIPIRKLVHTVTEAEIEKELERLRRINSTLQPAEKADHADHVVTVNMQDLDETGTPLIGKKTEDARFYLADEQLEQPFKDALANAHVGLETRIQFEHSHGEHVHSVNTRVNVTKVERVILPPLDDAFVTQITKDRFKTVADLRANITNDVHEYWKSKTERQVINEIIAELLKRHEFEVPETLVRSVLDGLKEEMKQEYPGKQLPADFDDARFTEQNRAYAVAQSKWALLREEIIAAEHLTVEDADLEAVAAQESERIKIDKERLIAFYKTSDQVKDRVVGDKLIKLLVQSASITEAPDTQPV
jgi:trigger factor